jgi:simple sugar transport system ATP-binding protein
MRAGALVDTVETAEATARSLATMMVGRELSLEVAKPPANPSGVTLRVRDLSYQPASGGQALHGIDFDIAAGEIVGLAGIEGNGQSELAEILAGLRHATSGAIHLDGIDLSQVDVAGHRKAGVGYIPSDRLYNAAALDASIADNLIVDRHSRPPIARRGWLRRRTVNAHADRLIEEYAIRTPDASVPVGSLSGGNMQKVVIARELSAAPRLLVASQATRGVDIGATHFIYGRIIEARDAGAAVFLVSADLTELLALADRLLVMRDGRLAARFDDTHGLTEKQVGLYMLGVEQHDRERLRSGLAEVSAA